MPQKKKDFIGNGQRRESAAHEVPSLGPVRFVRSIAATADLPAAECPEVAFVGRSNAGKSSALNALAGRKRLAYVSKQPGRTQLINFFALGKAEAHLVDLPGYGYAAVPGAVRSGWESLVVGYLDSRLAICGVVMIMDVRHPFMRLDCQLLEWLRPKNVPVLVLLSKADKLSRVQATQALTNVRRLLASEAPFCTAQLFSSLKGTGVEEALRTIRAWIGAASAVHKKPPVKGE
jgi:GTP-binding protein